MIDATKCGISVVCPLVPAVAWGVQAPALRELTIRVAGTDSVNTSEVFGRLLDMVRLGLVPQASGALLLHTGSLMDFVDHKVSVVTDAKG